MLRRRSSLALLLLPLLAFGAACNPQPITVTVIGDSHSDMDRVPRYDWIQRAPTTWVINEHAARGDTCRHTVLDALEAPAELAGDVMVIFCGTNDASYPTWDVAISIGWIEAAVVQGLVQGDPVVVVVPPPAETDIPVPAALHNARLAELRDAIYALQATYDIEVADVWNAILLSETPEAMLVEDGLHLDVGGQQVAFQEIKAAVDRAFSP